MEQNISVIRFVDFFRYTPSKRRGDSMKLSLIKTEEGHILELVRISKDVFESDVLVGAPIGDVPPQYDSVECPY